MRAVRFVHETIKYCIWNEWTQCTVMPYLNYLLVRVCVCGMFISNELNWVRAIYVIDILFLSIAHCPIRKTTVCVCVCCLSPPSFHCTLKIVCDIFYSVLSTFQCNASFTCQKRFIVHNRDTMRSVDQPKWICVHQLDSLIIVRIYIFMRHTCIE